MPTRARTRAHTPTSAPDAISKVTAITSPLNRNKSK
jgi:hypothetical protein